MVRSAYLKTVFRTIRDNLGRFIAVTLIILLGIAFVSGLGTLSYKMERALADAYDEAASPDIMIKSTSLFGISSSVTEQVEAYAGVKAVQSLTVIDTAEEAVNIPEDLPARLSAGLCRERRITEENRRKAEKAKGYTSKATNGRA